MAPRLADLGDLEPGDVVDMGGKALGLSRLLEAGARVPAGFAVGATTQPPHNWPARDRQELLERARPLLEQGPVVVRSSAPMEDSELRSFAGLFQSCGDVRDSQELIRAAGRCIGSGGTPRVRKYAGKSARLPVGLVVQRQVEPLVAGVCFTRDPGGRDHAIVVEAVSGRGSKLVGGEVEPERWRVYLSGLGRWEAQAEHHHKVLERAMVEALARQAGALEQALGHGLDLEWAVDKGGEIWWLQARPITTPLPPPPDIVIERAFAEVDDGPVSVWSNWNVRETLPHPLLPLTWTWWRDVLAPVVQRQVTGIPVDSPLAPHLYGLDLVNGRLYFNLNAVLGAPLVGNLFQGVIGAVDAEAGRVIPGLREEGVLGKRRLPGSRAAVAARTVLASFRGLLPCLRALAPRNSLKILELDAVRIARRPPLKYLEGRELLEEMRLWVHPECKRLLSGLQMELLAMVVFYLARRAFRAHPEALGHLATGIPANPTTRISLAVEALAARAGDHEGGMESDEWREGLQVFLHEFGHRGPREFDLGAPRWKDDPRMIIELVKTQLASDSSGSELAQRMKVLARERSRAVGKAIASAPLFRRSYLRFMARLVELYMPLREAPKHYGLVVFQRVREAALELGRRFSGIHALAAPEDVFFLTWPEISRWVLDGQAPDNLEDKIKERKKTQDHYQANPAPDYVRSDGVPVLGLPTTVNDEPGVLVGTPVSSGKASGSVRILTEPDPRVLAQGEVLVTRFADPGWTPLFPRAAAVVMEVGGLMCHAAVVAREMGVPAVFGVKGATERLSDGDQVTVDGDRGRVEEVPL